MSKNNYIEENLLCGNCRGIINDRMESARNIIFTTMNELNLTTIEILFILEVVKFQLLSGSINIKPEE
jgi:hypothetical protein